ncbi:MAG: cytochrome c [Gammaproteobacteria bacterium]|nr:cytochrome c [Gammaproteobacteria bacterium]
MITKIRITAQAAALLLLTSLFCSPALAQGDVEAGEKLAYTCLGCHGIPGYRNAYPSFRVPKLGGHTETYLVAALNGYRDGTRKHTTMQAQAQSLSEQEIKDVSAYFASFENETIAAGGPAGASFAKAQTCAACHGANGISNNPAWPTLAGQHEDYLEHSLNQYRNGKRQNAVMSAQAMIIAEEDVALLARYFASLDGLETTRPE